MSFEDYDADFRLNIKFIESKLDELRACLKGDPNINTLTRELELKFTEVQGTIKGIVKENGIIPTECICYV